MASFGQLTNAFLRASQETTIAFANLNFDFALVKYDAPEEYKELGEALSQRRKDTAEDGDVHVTARKLGALFHGIMPDVPNLILAYGRRAGEVAGKDKAVPKTAARQRVFADHMGADGTSIWAAATSGKETLTMHLLACMLARIWAREEAVSIWSELLEQRKIRLQKLVTESDMGFKVSDLTASRIEISRARLDDWDASARAWLQAADTAKALQQTQLRLVMDNISFSVSTHETLYEAVVDAWSSALVALENLVKGAPQRINSGAVLLGLSAWHIYPDILLAGTNQYIEQKDDLVGRGGVITIGLTNQDADDKGVFWSLPLAHARYYGDPVTVKRYAGVEQSQFTFENFVFVVLGSVIGSWKAPLVDTSVMLQLVRTLSAAVRDGLRYPKSHTWRYLSLEDRSPEQIGLRWLLCLGFAAERYFQATGLDLQLVNRLISFGRRRCSDFISGPHSQDLRFFGLTDFGVLARAFNEPPGTIQASGHGEFGAPRSVRFLARWAERELEPEIARRIVIKYWGSMYTRLDDRAFHHPRKRQKGLNSKPAGQLYHWGTPPRESLDEAGTVPADDMDEVSPAGRAMVAQGPGQDREPFRFLCGDSSAAAIFVPEDLVGVVADTRKVKSNHMDVPQLIRCIEQGDLEPKWIVSLLNDFCSHPGAEPAVQSLMAVAAAEAVYSKLPGAKVDLQVTSSTICKSHWWNEFRKPERQTLQAIFSCIAYFQTGGLDLDTSTIGSETFALCHASSIFVASCLLSDPLDVGSDSPVERITGNIGKPGLAFLLAPVNPKIRKLDLASWHMIAHEPFDGSPSEGFGGASFHLSFTGYELALDLKRRGDRDAPGSLLEATVSLHDKGEWVADLDILGASTLWTRFQPGPSCEHSPDQKQDVASLAPVVSMDSWLELLDPPIHHGILRAHGNWAARLAAAALATQLTPRRDVVILPRTPCWACVSSTVQALAATRDLRREAEKKAKDEGGESEGQGWTADQDSNYDVDEAPASIFDFPDLAGSKTLEEESSEDEDEVMRNSAFLIF